MQKGRGDGISSPESAFFVAQSFPPLLNSIPSAFFLMPLKIVLESRSPVRDEFAQDSIFASPSPLKSAVCMLGCTFGFLWLILRRRRKRRHAKKKERN